MAVISKKYAKIVCQYNFEVGKELYRVLKPSGRLMISAPNDWTDETGHLHVYTLEKECFMIYGQTAMERKFIR